MITNYGCSTSRNPHMRVLYNRSLAAPDRADHAVTSPVRQHEMDPATGQSIAGPVPQA